MYLINILPSFVLNFKSPGRLFILDHHLFKLLNPLVVLAIHTLGLIIRISFNPGHKSALFLDILLYQSVISASILPLTKYTFLVLVRLTSLFFLLLIILHTLILIFLSHLIFLIGFLHPLISNLILLMFLLCLHLIVLLPHFLLTLLLLFYHIY